MVDVRTIQCNPLQENCYVVNDESGDAVVIDCGAFYDAERRAIVDFIKKGGFQLRYVLCTHAHFDHIFGVDTLYKELGVKPRLHAADLPLYNSMSEQTAMFMGPGFTRELPPLGDMLSDGETIHFGNSREMTALHTPGHSPGSVLFYMKEEKLLFAGDTLFRMSVGRTDLEGGSWEQLMDSLHNVVALLPTDVKVYTGHGPATTIGDELKYNPYLREDIFRF